jgi:hypothetical protein
LAYAQNNRIISIVCVSENDDDIIGYDEALDNDCVHIRQISNFGCFDGIATVIADSVLRVVINDSDAGDLVLLGQGL